MMNPEKVSLKLSRFVKITRLNKLLILATLAFIIGFSIFSLMRFPPIDITQNLYGFTTDFINLVVIFTIFFVVQCSQLAKKAYVYVSIGLMLWIVGSTADVLDEVTRQPFWVSNYIEDLCRTLGMLVTAYGLFKTMHFMQRMHTRLAQEFIIDDLTKVYNRRCFYQHVKGIANNPYTVLIIDIDHFKRINDDFGHDVGDQVLKQFASKVNALFNNENTFARIGGEEFATYLPSYELDEVLNFAQTILETARTITVQNQRSLTVSIGIAHRSSEQSFDNVMKRADQALYRAKKAGRDRLEVA